MEWGPRHLVHVVFSSPLLEQNGKRFILSGWLKTADKACVVNRHA